MKKSQPRCYFQLRTHRIPSIFFAILLVLVGAAAVTGLVLKDQLSGRTSVATSQALAIDYTSFSSGDVYGGDEALVTVKDDGSQWSVHVEANNGDLITIELPVSNLGNENVVAELYLKGGSPYTVGGEPIYYWSDADHNGAYTGGTLGEAVLDPRGGSDNQLLERGDTIIGVGTTDYLEFSSNHWFFDASHTAAGTYGSGGALGPSYNDDIFSDYDGVTPEAILLDGGTIGVLDTGVLNGTDSPDTVVTSGKAALENDFGPFGFTGSPLVSEGVDMLYFDSTLGSAWQKDYDIFINGDGDNYYTTQADEFVHSGAATLPIVAGTKFEPFDATDNVYWDDPGVSYVWDGTDSMWTDAHDDGVYAVHGTSIGVSGAVTDLTSTSYPPDGILDGTLNISIDGKSSERIAIHNTGEIVAETLSWVGTDYLKGISSIGYWLEVGNTGKHCMLTDIGGTSHNTSMLQVICDDSFTGDELVAADDFHVKWIDSESGSDFYLTFGSQKDLDGDAVLSLDVVVPPFTKATISAGDLLKLSTGGPYFIAGESKTVDNTFAVNWLGSLKVLVLRGQSFSAGLFDKEIEIVTPSATPLSADIDEFYLDSATDIAAAIEYGLGGQATVTYNDPNFPIAYKIDSVATNSSSAVVVSPNTLGTDLTSHLKLGLAQGGTEYLGGDVEITGGPIEHVTITGTEQITAAGSPMSYLDGELAVADGLYQIGEDIYWEHNPGAGTYSPASMTFPETVVYVGGNGQQLAGGFPPVAGTQATYFEAADNVWYRDWDHDTWYDAGEPLLISTDATLDNADEVLARADSPGTWTIGHGTDMWNLETDFSGSNGHDYYYIDHNDDGLYSDGEAILDQIYGATNDLIRLEEDDFVIHHGLANLDLLPLAMSGSGSWKYKFLVPSVCNLGSPLRIKLHFALEDAASTGFYQLYGTVKPVNY